ncbi:isoprenylcysteine carboxylmethyltransferase family protein [Pseudonocardia alni]|uniref:isoprenylcysteine carboxylmethyltransferase family protein n=1 Tax=Pseudonocardia alni TaxID=33907 RepID=UPI00367ACE12
MTSFANPQQLNGGETGDLVTAGNYRYIRHPQYAGFVAAAAGLTVNELALLGHPACQRRNT